MKRLQKLLMLVSVYIGITANAETVLLSTEQIEIGGKQLVVATLCKDDYVYTLYTDGDKIAIVQEFEKTKSNKTIVSTPIKCGAPE